MASCEQCIYKQRVSGKINDPTAVFPKHYECFFCAPAWDRPASLCDRFVYDPEWEDT